MNRMIVVLAIMVQGCTDYQGQGTSLSPGSANETLELKLRVTDANVHNPRFNLTIRNRTSEPVLLSEEHLIPEFLSRVRDRHGEEMPAPFPPRERVLGKSDIVILGPLQVKELYFPLSDVVFLPSLKSGKYRMICEYNIPEALRTATWPVWCGKVVSNEVEFAVRGE